MGATLNSSFPNATVRGTNDADYFQVYGTNAAIFPFDGDDTIYIYSSSTNSSVLAGGYSGDKYFYLQGKNSFIQTGEGDHRFVGYGTGSTVITANGNNSIMGYVPSLTAHFGAGNDTVTAAMGAACYFDLGDGDNSARIFKGAANTTILGGTGNNNITLTKTPNVTIVVRPGGNTHIQGFNETTTLQVAENFTTVRSADDIIVKVGSSGTITLEGTAELGAVNIVYDHESLLSGTEGDDYIHITESSVVYNAQNGDDSVEVSGDNVTILGGSGYDTIQSGNIIYTDVLSPFDDTVIVRSYGGTHNWLEGGAGNDVISNNGKYDDTKDASGHYPLSNEPNHATLLGGDGNDSLINGNGGSFSFLAGGADNDRIVNHANNCTIDGGNGADTIETGGTAVSVFSGDGTDTVANSGDRSTITGGNGNKRISSSGETVLISTGNGNDYIINGGAATIRSGDGNDTISSDSSDVYIDSSAGNNFISSRGKRVTITGGGNSDTINFWGSDSGIDAGTGNDYISADSSNNLTIQAGAGDDTISLGSVLTNSNGAKSYYNLVNNSTISASAGNKVIYNNSGENNTFIFTETANSTLFGVDESSVIVFGESGTETYAVNERDNDLQITSNNRTILIIDGATMPSLTIVGEEVVDDDEPQLRLNGNVATYGTTNETLFTISGVTSLEGIFLNEVDDHIVTVAQASLGTSTVTISDGYYLNLDYDVDTPETATAWTTSGTTATLKETSTAGYVLTSDSRSIVYQKAKAGITLAKLTGLKSGLRVDGYGEIAGISVDDTDQVITLDAEVLTSKTVKVTAGNYTLAPGNNVEEPAQTEPSLTVSGTKILLKASNRVGYTLSADEKSMKFTPASVGKTIAAVSGVAKGLRVEDGEIDGVEIDFENQIITLSEAALDATNVKATGDFTLALTDDVPEPEEADPKISVSGTKLIVKSAITAGYTLSDDERSAVYTRANAGKTLATLTGVAKVKAIDGEVEGVEINTDTQIITLSANILGTSTVKVTNGNYTLALADDVEEIGEDENIWSISGTKATFKTVTPASHELSANEKSVLYHKEVTHETLATVSGIVKDTAVEDGAIEGIEVDEDTSLILLNSDALGKKVSVSSTTYGFAFDEEYSNASITGSKSDDTISVAGSKLTITGGKGNDYIDLGEGGDHTFVYAKGDGDDVVVNFTEEDKIKLMKGTVKSVDTEGDDVVITVGNGTLTLIDAAGQDISINGKLYSTVDNDYFYDLNGSNGYWFADDSNFENNFIGGGDSSLDEISAEYAVTNFETAKIASVDNLVTNDSLSSALTFAK